MVYDLSDENSGGEPSFLSKFDLDGNAEQVSITDDGAYIACDDFGAYFISLESIRTGEGVAVSFAEDLTVDHVSVKSNVAVLSLGSRGLALYDVSDPLSPISKGSLMLDTYIRHILGRPYLNMYKIWFAGLKN